jgi:hypothetical protein
MHWLRQIGIVTALVVCLGCSSLSTLFLKNESDQPIRYTVTLDGRERLKSTSGEVAKGEAEEIMNHMGVAILKFEITSDTGRQVFEFDRKSLPPEIAAPSSGGAEVEAVFDGDRIRFRVLTSSKIDDTFRLAMGLICAGSIAAIWLVRKLLKKARRTP